MKIYRTNRKWGHEHIRSGPMYRNLGSRGVHNEYTHTHRFAFMHIGVAFSYKERVF